MNKKIFLYLSFGFLILSLFVASDYLYHKKYSKQTLARIAPCSRFNPDLELPPLTEEESHSLETILSMPFAYYSKGSQALIFLSEDGKYILKVFKQRKLMPTSWLAYLPFSFNPYHREFLKRKCKHKELLESCKTAYTQLKEETGLIYVHLNPTQNLRSSLTLLDKKGKTYRVNPNEILFQIQKKADLVYPRITSLMAQRDVERAKNAISSVLEFLVFLAKKGVYDNDPIIRRNFGFIGDQAVQIDVGKLKIDPIKGTLCSYAQDTTRISSSFKRWIDNNYPELTPHFENKLQEISSRVP